MPGTADGGSPGTNVTSGGCKQTWLASSCSSVFCAPWNGWYWLIYFNIFCVLKNTCWSCKHFLFQQRQLTFESESHENMNYGSTASKFPSKSRFRWVFCPHWMLWALGKSRAEQKVTDFKLSLRQGSQYVWLGGCFGCCHIGGWVASAQRPVRSDSSDGFGAAESQLFSKEIPWRRVVQTHLGSIKSGNIWYWLKCMQFCVDGVSMLPKVWQLEVAWKSMAWFLVPDFYPKERSQ